MKDIAELLKEELSKSIWETGEEIKPHVWFAGFTEKGLGVIFETDRWSEVFRILLNDFLGKYIFRAKGRDIKIVIRKTHNA